MRLKNINTVFCAILGLFLLSMNACKKDKAEEPVTPVTSCVGDSGGTTVLIVDLKHHALQIPNDSVYPDTVWIKYNAVNAGSGFDEEKIGVPGDTTIIFTGLKCGNYYLTASGYDRSIGLTVTGGIGISIAENLDTVAYTVPVVE